MLVLYHSAAQTLVFPITRLKEMANREAAPEMVSSILCNVYLQKEQDTILDGFLYIVQCLCEGLL